MSLQTLSQQSVEYFSDQLHRYAAMQFNGRMGLLLDQTRSSFDEKDPSWSWFESERRYVVRIKHPEIALKRCPLVIELATSEYRGSEATFHSCEDALAELEKERLLHGGGRRSGGWLFSEVPLPDVVHHLGNVLLQTTPDGGLAWLRAQDPRVLWALWPLLGPAQKSAYLGPIHSIVLLDPEGGTCVFEHVPEARRGLGMSLRLSASQWTDVESFSSLHLALIHRLEDDTRKLDVRRSIAMAALRRARALGFSDTNDLAAFAEKSLTVHPAFERHPKVSDLLAVRQPGDFFTWLVGDLSIDDWSSVAQEMAVDTLDQKT